LTDKSTSLIVEALGKALAEPVGSPLHTGKAGTGLFPVTAIGKQAAQRCKDESLLQVVRTEAKGKTVHEICAITEKGLAYLLAQVSPKQVLEDLLRALTERRNQVGDLVETARQTQATFDALKEAIEKVLHQLARAHDGSGPFAFVNGSETWQVTVLSFLRQWQADHASEDCSLAELFQQARKTVPALSIGHFHDGVRRLHEREQIYLHPWTGPLYDLPEPAYALLAGHEIAYYASLRQQPAP
jgi:hypothetical protein